LGFFSRKLSVTEHKYSTFDRELLASFCAIRHFRFMLEGRHFQLWTDHKPLLAALDRVAQPWTPRQQRQLAFIAECTGDVLHVPGVANVVADALSRPNEVAAGLAAPAGQAAAHAQLSTRAARAVAGVAHTCEPPLTPPGVPALGRAAREQPAQVPDAPACSEAADSCFKCFSLGSHPVERVPVDYSALAAAQQSCPGVAALRAGSSLTIVTRDVEGQPLLGDISTGTFRPLLPLQYKQVIFDCIHGIAHPGMRASKRLILSRFVWKRAAADVAAMARACLTCQQGKVTRHVHVRPLHIDVPTRRFSHIHVDLVGPLPESEGFTYLFTVIDRTTRWAEAVPLRSTAAADCAHALFRGWIARFGVPAAITSDRGSQFTSALWAALCRVLNIQHVQTTAYHPEGNGLVERFHRRLKDALRARCAGPRWVQHLPWVMLGLQAAAREDTGISPAQSVLGAALALPGELAADSELSVTQFLSNMQRVLDNPLLPVTGTRHNTAASRAAPTELPAALLTAPYVLVRRDGHVPPLELLYDGPYAVLRRCPQYFTIQLGDREEVVSTSRLKPCQSPVTVAAQPRTRGRPRGSGTRSGLPPRRLPGPAQTPPAQPEPGGEDTPVPANPPQPPRGGGSGRHYVARGPPTASSPPSWAPPSVGPASALGLAGRSGLPPCRPASPPRTPPVLHTGGEPGTHGRPAPLPLAWGGSGASPPSWAPPSSSTPSRLASSSPPSWAPPSVVYPSSCLRTGQQRRPVRHVSFQDDQPAAPAPPADSGPESGTVFPSTPAGVFARPDSASTMRPPRQRRRPPHLDLYTEVWGEPCRSSANSAIRTWQEVPSLRPEVWQQWRCATAPSGKSATVTAPLAATRGTTAAGFSFCC